MKENVEHAADVGMSHTSGELNLPAKALHRLFVLNDVGADRLEGDVLSQLEVFRLVNLTHATAPEGLDDAKSVGEQVALSEPKWAGGFWAGSTWRLPVR